MAAGVPLRWILPPKHKGKSIPDIASELDFPQSYVHNMLLCAQSLAEEDIVAIAMLMLRN